MPEQLISGEYLIPPIMTGVRNELLHLVLWFRKRKIEAINNVLLNDIVISDVDLDSEGVVISGLYANKVTIHKHLGEQDQAADSLMISEIEWWTAKHRFRGVPYLYVKLRWCKKVFHTGIPIITAWIR